MRIKLNKHALFTIFLVLLIIAGVFFRFYGLDSQLIQMADEPRVMVASINVFYNDFYEGQFWINLHPPIGYWSYALLTPFVNNGFSEIKKLSLDEFDYLHVPSQDFKKIYFPERIMMFIYGCLSLLGLFLITRYLFDTKKALISTAAFALSFDMIGLGRLLFFEIPAIAFMFLSMYFFFQFIENGKNANFKFILSIIFFILSIGSRIQPIMLLIVFVIGILKYKTGGIVKIAKKKRGAGITLDKGKIGVMLVYLLVIISALIIFYSLIYFPAARAQYEAQMGKSSLELTFWDLNFGYSAIATLLRDNLLYTFCLAATITWFLFAWVKKKSFFGKTEKSKSAFLFMIFIIMAFFIFSIIKQTSSLPVRYTTFFAAGLFVLFGHSIVELGKAISKKVKKFPLLTIIFVGISVIVIVQGIFIYPYFSSYSQFGFQPVANFKPELENSKAILDYLEARGNPIVITNQVNVLMFYKGESYPIVKQGDSLCSKEIYDKAVAEKGLLIVDRPNFDVLSRQCSYYSNLIAQFDTNIGNYGIYTITGEALTCQ